MMVVDMRGILTEAQWKQIVDRRDQWRAEREGEMRKRFRNQRGDARPGGARPGSGVRRPHAAPEAPEEP